MRGDPAQHDQGNAGYGVLPLVCVTAFAVVLNGTMLPVALPELGEALSLGRVSLGWVITGYFLMNGVAIPFFGRLADLYGVDRLYGAGLAMFFAGSVLCALAPNFGVLIAGRLVQGVGAAAVVGLGPTAVSLIFSPARRGRAIGLVGAAVGAGAAAGPVLGGLVVESLGWRFLFAAGALFGALAPLALRVLPRGEPSNEGRLDFAGGLLLALTLGGGLLALTKGAEDGLGGPLVITSAAVAVLSLVGFVLRQATAVAPFVPRALLRSSTYVWLCVVTLLLVGNIIAVEVGVPLPLAELNGLGAAQIGLVLFPPAIVTIVWGPVAGRIVDRLGVGPPLAGGTTISLAGILLLSGFGVGGPAWLVSALVTVVGLGATLAKIATTTEVSLTVPGENLPSGIATNEMVWISGTSLGTALFSAVAAARSGASDPLNPLHAGAGAGYSDAFLLLTVPLLFALFACAMLGSSAKGSGKGGR